MARDTVQVTQKAWLVLVWLIHLASRTVTRRVVLPWNLHYCHLTSRNSLSLDFNPLRPSYCFISILLLSPPLLQLLFTIIMINIYIAIVIITKPFTLICKWTRKQNNFFFLKRNVKYMKTKTKKIGCQTDVKQNKQKKTEFYYTTMSFWDKIAKNLFAFLNWTKRMRRNFRKMEFDISSKGKSN